MTSETQEQQVRDPNGVVTDASGSADAQTTTIARFRDPEPLAGETGAQYTARVRSMRQAHDRGETLESPDEGKMAPPVDQIMSGSGVHPSTPEEKAEHEASKQPKARTSTPGDLTDPTPLSGVRVGQDPLGISTGRTLQTQIEAEGTVPADQPGVRSDEDEAARLEEQGGEDEAAEEGETVAKKGKLPDDFPGRAALEANGITTYGQVRKAVAKEQLTELNGIGKATAEKIEAEL